MTSVKWRGREIHNPVLRALACGALIVVLPVCFLIAAGVFLGVLLAMPFHPILALLGRRGFVSMAPDGGIAFHVDATSFQRR